MANILLIDDEIKIRALFTEYLEDCGYNVTQAENGEVAKKYLSMEINGKGSASKDTFDIVLCDLVMPQCNGEQLFAWMHDNDLAHIPFVCISGKSDMQDVMSIIQKGAFDFISKPLQDLNELKAVTERAIAASRQHHGLISLTNKVSSNEPMNALIGRSPKFLKVAQMIARVAATNTTVLITGESGTGKEVVARAIHNMSQRADAPFVAVNCAAIPSTLIESELFGYEKGAFTGASTSKIGRFTQANKGTIFLDEIGEFDISVQSKLLRVLQERVIEPVGSTRSIPVDNRIIAATNRDLDKMVAQNTFRADLLYRLRVYPINLPPLRERKEDILPLCRYLASKIAARLNIEIPSLTTESFQKLFNHSWPGNIRELENTLERALIEKAHSGVILPEDLPIVSVPEEILPTKKEQEFSFENNFERHPFSDYKINLVDNVEFSQESDNFILKIPKEGISWHSIERCILSEILVFAKGNISKAAKMLQLSRSHLRSRLRFHNLGK